ncbi:Ger(x)C family spore germination protein [Paenibacillus antri]|uniref:Ger(x)C family spore germination protein n=1 Tax=Paenibacillus antri TaxID=2582848 RepID=UPI0013054603|nr:Ger(x)C family spore germination protein [Paenibacillus antri]
MNPGASGYSLGRRRWWLLLLLLPVMTGCWGRQEVNDIGIVTATAVDRSDNGDIVVMLLFAIPRLVGTSSMTGGGGESKMSTTAGWVVTAGGETVMDAFRNIQAKLPRTIYFSHNRVLLLGERLAREGIAPVLDVFQRNRQSQLNSFVLVAEHPEDILRFKPTFEKLSSEIIEEEIVRGVGTNVRLVEFLAMLHAEGQEAFAPVVELTKSTEKKNGSNLRATTKTAAFRGDRLVGLLGDEATRGLVWLRNEVRDGVITIQVPESRGGGKISAEIKSGSTRFRPSVRDGRVRIRIETEATLDIAENASKMEIERHLGTVESYFERDLEERLRALCDKVQRNLHTDIVGFGQSLYRNDPKRWRGEYAERWDETFPNVRADISVSVQVLNTGLVGKRVDIWEEER